MMQCEHIHGDGARCLSPAMHRRAFCYMHWRQREHKLTVPEPEFQLPTIDSEASVVLASNQIAHAVLAGKLDTKRARIVLACLKMAVDSLRRQPDISGISELELTPAMRDEFAAAAQARCEHGLKSAPVPQLAASEETPPPSPLDSVETASVNALSSRAARRAARDLLLDRDTIASSLHRQSPDEDLERFIDQHPLMKLKRPTLEEAMEAV